MEDVEDTLVNAYRDELIIELTGTDQYGGFAVISYRFDFDGESGDTVRPKQSIESDHVPVVVDALENEGYRLEAGER